MQTAKSWFQLVMALLPVLFFGGFFLYFTGVNNAFGGMFDGSLGPTRIGLGALTILFALLFLWKLRRLGTPPALPKSGGPGGVDAAVEETRSDFDADAAMARYLARRGAGGPAVPQPKFAPPADRPPPGSFGRKRSFE